MDSTAATAVLAAVGCAGVWTGAAVLGLADPVAYYDDMKQSTQELLRDWRRMFPAAKKMQGAVNVLGTVSALTAANGLRDSNDRAAAAFGAMAAFNMVVFGYTMVKIMPLNHRLLPEGEVEKSESDGSIRGMLQEWGRMHGTRTVFGVLALGSALYGAHCLLTSK